MAFQDAVVNFRETLLKKLLGIPPHLVLNAGPVSSSLLDGMVLAAEIKQAMNAFKAAAMDDNGEHVNYVTLASSPAYAQYRTECSPRLQHFDPATLQTREEKLAFWINLYNALIVDSVIQFGVTDSVAQGLDILRFFRRAAHNVGGQRMTAEDMEHGILRANRGNPYLPGSQFVPNDPRRKWILKTVDPRIHFALNCASKSCPPIGVYSPDQVDAQLDLAAQNFIAHEVRLDMENKTLSLSQIFHWYQADFGGLSGTLAFVSEFLPKEKRDWLAARGNGITFQFVPYDWGLNSKVVNGS